LVTLENFTSKKEQMGNLGGGGLIRAVKRAVKIEKLR